MDFETWMKAEGLSESSVRKYAGAINGSLSEWGSQGLSSPKQIRTIHDSQEFAALAELIENTDTFIERNSRGKHMYSSALRQYARYLDATSSKSLHIQIGPFASELNSLESDELPEIPYDPKGQEDARTKVLREVIRRQGQQTFRRKLMEAYESKCAFSRCSIHVLLEAAHITPYLGKATNMLSNGLLLRADFHTLWDAGLMAIDPATMEIAISAEVEDAGYCALAGKAPFEPLDTSARPSMSALKEQWSVFNKTGKAK